MKQNRREFLTAASCLGVVSMLRKGSATEERKGGDTMLGFAAPPLAKVRVALAPGINSPLGHLCRFPGVEISALCAETADDLKYAKRLIERDKLPPPKEYIGADACKRMVDDGVADVFYNSMYCLNNTELNVYAMNGKMHVVSAPPVRCTIDDCWKLVETSEKNKVHCTSGSFGYIYGEYALFALNVVRHGLLGDVVTCGGTYFMDQRSMWNRKIPARQLDRWETRMVSQGVSSPWDVFAPLSRCLDINRGDRLETLVAMSSGNESLRAFAESNKDVSLSDRLTNDSSDTCATLIRTAKGRLVTLRQALTLSCPLYAPVEVCGTKGTLIFGGTDGMKMTCDKVPGGERTRRFFDDKITDGMRNKLRHPLWESGGEVARKLSRQGGAALIGDMWRIYCLRNGLPMGVDVYDFATWASLMELTDKSARAAGQAVKVPDFTRGGWKSASPMPVEDVDVDKFLQA